MESNPIRLPYKHLKDAELELVGFDDSRVANGMPNGGTASSTPAQSPPSYPKPSEQARFGGLKMLILSSTVGAGVQFGWALQLSLLTPYVQPTVFGPLLNVGDAKCARHHQFKVYHAAPRVILAFRLLGESSCPCLDDDRILTLGISHAFSSFIWLCGPITGLVVQPCVGIWSDKCYSKYGKRRPFILIGSLMISVAVTTIGFAADIGYLLGDTKEHCSTYKGTRVGAAIVFVIGFWMLDLANNTVQGPARALLADLSGPDQKNSANAIFCSWMAVGNILGYSAGASGNWHRWFPFLTTRACCEACANLKAAFLVAVVFLSFCTLMTLHFAKEIPLAKPEHRLSDSAPLLNDKQPIFGDSSVEMIVGDHASRTSGTNTTENSRNVALKDEEDQSEVFNDGPGAVLVNLLTSMRHLPPAMHSVLVVMALSWLSWFPFILFDTDWMGREVYHGDPNGNASQFSVYGKGVREGAFGLLLNSVVLGVSSLLIEPMCRCMGSRLVWAMSNFTVFICMTSITVISLVSVGITEGIQDVIGDNRSIKTAALVIFSLLGFPLAITYSVPFSVTAEVTADTGGGQGLAIGVLNLAIVIPQIIVSLGAGPWDALFGGGNIPAFALASLSALAAGVIAILKLPNLSSSAYKSTGFHFG